MKRLRLLALPLLLAACPARQAATDAAPPPPPNAPMPPPAPQAPDLAAELPRFHWRLQDATDASGKRIDALFARAELPLQLDFRDGRIAVANTCNRMMGRYATSAGTLTVERLASTMMACVDPRLIALDREAGARLQGPLAMGLVAGDAPRLTLRNAAGDQLTFAGTPTPETRYGGPGERIFLEVAAQTAPCSHPLIPDKQCLQVRELQSATRDRSATSTRPSRVTPTSPAYATCCAWIATRSRTRRPMHRRRPSCWTWWWSRPSSAAERGLSGSACRSRTARLRPARGRAWHGRRRPR